MHPNDRCIDFSSAPLVMGVLNITPDSFSDGGKFLHFDNAVHRALTMIEQGANLIDIGAESTRPGAADVSADEQIARAIPVIEAVRQRNQSTPIAIDTRLAAVAEAALETGADIVNDTSALRDDPTLVDVVAGTGASVVLMHRRGRSATMQAGGGPEYSDVIGEIQAFLRKRVRFAVSRGISEARIIVDPGIGFGKRTQHNLLILSELGRFVELGPPVLVGASRKRFIGSVLGIEEPQERDAASVACAIIAARAGASIIRAHDVRATVQALQIQRAVRDSGRSAHASCPEGRAT